MIEPPQPFILLRCTDPLVRWIQGSIALFVTFKILRVGSAPPGLNDEPLPFILTLVNLYLLHRTKPRVVD
ncbi:MAG TPA: hypothetical protein VJ572_00400 [Azonexus sp.]|nr:hypothetical protein [Azonexus sp.]